MIILPCGLTVGGVTSWAVRLVNNLCRERACGLVLHAPTPGIARYSAKLDDAVRVFELPDSARVEEANGDIGPIVNAYGEVVRRFCGSAPVALIPNLLGDCYGACAAMTRDESLDVRVVGWAHSENGYDARVLGHYEAALCRAGAVSTRLATDVRKRWPGREADVELISTGVESGGARSTSGPARTIVYTGRMDEGVKRVSALIHMSDILEARGVSHRLLLVGDGPDAAAIDRMIAARSKEKTLRMMRVASASPEEIRIILRLSEFFVLPSRFEGLSVSMLEAMSEGCCCVVTAENSGAPEAIEHGVSGILLTTASSASAERAGVDLADALMAISPARTAELGEKASCVVRERFTIAAHARAVSKLLDMAVHGPVRRWPREKQAAFTARPGTVGSGTVPSDADVRLRLVMDSLRGRNVVVHGTGRHSVELAHVLGEYVAEIQAFIDDDPARQGMEFLGKPVVAPNRAANLGATDIVISSHLHQDAIWSRRDEYERVGVRVHRLYS